MENIGANSGQWNIVWFVVLAIIVMLVMSGIYIFMMGQGRAGCPISLHRKEDGTLTLYPGGQVFGDMNAFQQWWASNYAGSSCPIPRLTGAREVVVLRTEQPQEETYAKTPINKVDDYEFSRIFGYERDGYMVEPREDYNRILLSRQTDWVEKPLSSDERRDKYAGLKEGFTAEGVLTSVPVASQNKKNQIVEPMRPVSEIAARFGEHSNVHPDVQCKIDRETREVAEMVAEAYESDPDWEPVVTKVGPHHWEVAELKPRRRFGPVASAVEERIVDTNNDAVDIRFRYREKAITDAALDPYFSGYPSQTPDPFQGTVPGMERMFGPTLDRVKWY